MRVDLLWMMTLPCIKHVVQVVNKDRVFSGGRDASVRLWSRGVLKGVMKATAICINPFYDSDKDTIKIFFKEGNHIPVTCLQVTSYLCSPKLSNYLITHFIRLHAPTFSLLRMKRA